MQTILGAGGALSTGLARVLPKYSSKIRLVGRDPEKVNEGDLLFKADLTDPQQVRAAVQGSEVAYLTVGLPYKLKVWQEQWPVIMNNVIRACGEADTRLVFFDNMYMYEADSLNPMKESHIVNPPSKKGKVRQEIATLLLKAIDKGELQGQIARAADFYGPSIQKVSLLTETIFKPLSQGKKANWMGKANKKHSFTYVPDAAAATALLGNTPEAYGQVWHLPTAPDPYTGEEWVQHIAEALGVEPRYRSIGTGMLGFLGFFLPMMRELAEMAYQYDRDYVFDSSKFERKFGIIATSYAEGIRQIVAADYAKQKTAP
jgi:nucleoside-diphosphate-sugar epimerase